MCDTGKNDEKNRLATCPESSENWLYKARHEEHIDHILAEAKH